MQNLKTLTEVYNYVDFFEKLEFNTHYMVKVPSIKLADELISELSVRFGEKDEDTNYCQAVTTHYLRGTKRRININTKSDKFSADYSCFSKHLLIIKHK
jgi:hypothetical protein